MESWPSATVQSLPDQVAQLILKRIATGDLQPGHRLPSQRDLAQSMGVGLAVIREAVQRLAALNIVEASHGSGTVIRPFSWMPLLYDPSLFNLAMQRLGVADLWEARQVLEGQIVRLAVQRRTGANLKKMRDVLDCAIPLPTHFDVSQKLNHKFHMALAEASQNAVLADLLRPLLDVQMEGIERHYEAKRSKATWDAHRAIHDAVAARDLAAAERAIDQHFKIGPIALKGIHARALSTRPSARK